MACPSRCCPLRPCCRAAMENVPAACYYGLVDPVELRQLMSHPGHPAQDEWFPDDEEIIDYQP